MADHLSLGITQNQYPVQVTLTGGVSYDSFRNSLGSYVYGIDKVYFRCSSISQLNNPVTYNYYDANGNIQQFVVSPTIDPYQKYPSLIVALPPDFVLDGNSQVQFNLDPSVSLTLTLIAKEIKEKDLMNKGHYNPIDKTIEFQLKNQTNQTQSVILFASDSSGDVGANVYSSSYNLSGETYATTNTLPTWVYVALGIDPVFVSGVQTSGTIANISQLASLLNARTSSLGITWSYSGTTLYSQSTNYATGTLGVGTIVPF